MKASIPHDTLPLRTPHNYWNCNAFRAFFTQTSARLNQGIGKVSPNNKDANTKGGKNEKLGWQK
jgi:hypothetical protein